MSPQDEEILLNAVHKHQLAIEELERLTKMQTEVIRGLLIRELWRLNHTDDNEAR